MAAKGRYEIDMCNGPILPKMLRFALPLMLSSILQLLFNAADVVVVGRFAGDNSLAAVGSTTSLVNLLVNFFIGLSVGANITAARFRGAGDKEGLRQTVHTSMLVGLISGIFLTVLGTSLAGTLLGWMQSPPAVRELAALYLRIYFLGMPAALLYNFGAAMLRATGDTKRPLYFLLAAGVLNVALNLFLVIVCHMGVAGVAIATVVSQVVSAALVVLCLLRHPGDIRLDLRQLRIWPQRLKEILRIGMPAGLQSVLFSLSNVVIQSSINGFGETVIAGSAAAGNIEGFVYVCMNAFYQANISFTSQNIGAGRYERIRPILLRAVACVFVVGLAVSSLAVVFGPQLLGIYSDSPDVIAAGMERMMVICLPYVLCGLMEVTAGSLRGIGYSVLPMLITMLGACGLRLLWVATVFQLPSLHTVQTVYFSYPISWVLTTAAQLISFAIAWKRLRRKLTA